MNQEISKFALAQRFQSFKYLQMNPPRLLGHKTRQLFVFIGLIGILPLPQARAQFPTPPAKEYQPAKDEFDASIC